MGTTVLLNLVGGIALLLWGCICCSPAHKAYRFSNDRFWRKADLQPGSPRRQFQFDVDVEWW